MKNLLLIFTFTLLLSSCKKDKNNNTVNEDCGTCMSNLDSKLIGDWYFVRKIKGGSPPSAYEYHFYSNGTYKIVSSIVKGEYQFGNYCLDANSVGYIDRDGYINSRIIFELKKVEGFDTDVLKDEIPPYCETENYQVIGDSLYVNYDYLMYGGYVYAKN